jgi:hypothetical protein
MASDGTIAMPRPGESVPDRVVSAGIALAVVGVVVQTGIHLFNGWVLNYKWGILNVTEDESVFGWASSATTFGAALAVVLFGVTRRSRPAEPIVLAAIISFLSLDDFLQLHERVASLWKPLGLWEKADRLVWPAIFMPLLAATFILALRLSAEAGTRVSRLCASASSCSSPRSRWRSPLRVCITLVGMIRTCRWSSRR